MDTAARTPQPFRRYVGLSVGLHAGMLVLAATLAALRPPPPLPAVVPVTLLARLPGGAPPGPVSAAPPAADPAPVASPPPASAPAPTRVLLPKQPAPRPVPKREAPEVRPQPAPAREQPTPPAPSAAEAGGAPALATASGTGSGSGAQVAALGPGSGSAPGARGGVEDPLELYASLVRARIQAQRRYSPMARRRGLEGVVMVRLQLAASGEVAELRVEDGAPLLLARSTEDAVARAGPFPPPPTGLGVLRIPVRYRLTD